jgi:hypothetical protein
LSTYYDYLDAQVNDLLNIDMGFNNLLGANLYYLDPGAVRGFFERYLLIKEFQEITLSLFHASLCRELDPQIAALVLSELPEHVGWNYHKQLLENNVQQHRTPTYFRTDEVADGKIIEIQCPGSAWGLYELLYSFFTDHASTFGGITNFRRTLSEQFASSLAKHLGKEPIVHHLMDNASIPHCVRFFIQKTRKQRVRYFGYDKGITPYNCNLIRGHDFQGLVYEAYAKRRISAWTKGLLDYDLPPSILFEVKITDVFPFWAKTMHYYRDKVRGLFPFTQWITPEGFFLEDGSWTSIEQFCRLSQKQRHYYVKYAGSDVDLNWGSKGVRFLGSYSRVKSEELFGEIIRGYHSKKYWIIQKAHHINERAAYITRDDSLLETELYAKLSGFYGPDGLMGVLAMLRPFSKVHGAINTILTICK